MKQYSRYSAYIAILFIFLYCQPSTLVKKEPKTTGVDSTLYFRQMDVDDPFLDTIFQGPDTQIVLQKKLLPPEKPQQRSVKQVEGFRVQIFAGVDSINALAILDQAEILLADTVYFIKDKGLFKLQTGDYLYRPEADSVRTFVRSNGYDGAWVVKRMINLYDLAEEVAPVISDDQQLPEGRYKIQVAATSTQSGAREIIDALKAKIAYPVYDLQSGALYKVYVGNFQDETAARAVLDEIRAAGYPDAWLVY
jgi:hypothetical protein